MKAIKLICALLHSHSFPRDIVTVSNFPESMPLYQVLTVRSFHGNLTGIVFLQNSFTVHPFKEHSCQCLEPDYRELNKILLEKRFGKPTKNIHRLEV